MFAFSLGPLSLEELAALEHKGKEPKAKAKTWGAKPKATRAGSAVRKR